MVTMDRFINQEKVVNSIKTGTSLSDLFGLCISVPDFKSFALFDREILLNAHCPDGSFTAFIEIVFFSIIDRLFELLIANIWLNFHLRLNYESRRIYDDAFAIKMLEIRFFFSLALQIAFRVIVLFAFARRFVFDFRSESPTCKSLDSQWLEHFQMPSFAFLLCRPTLPTFNSLLILI